MKELISLGEGSGGRLTAQLIAGIIDNGYISHRDYPATRVAVDPVVGTKLTDSTDIEPSLLTKFAAGGLSSGLVHIHKSSGESPAPFIWFVAALYKQHPDAIIDVCKNYAVSCQSRPRIFVTVHIRVVGLFCTDCRQQAHCREYHG